MTAHAKDRGECRWRFSGQAPNSDHPNSSKKNKGSRGKLSPSSKSQSTDRKTVTDLTNSHYASFLLSPRLYLNTLTVNSSTYNSVLNLFHPHRFTFRLLCCTCFLSAQLPLLLSPSTLPLTLSQPFTNTHLW